MNKIFRVIWNHATQSWVAVSELQSAKGKTKSTVSKVAVALAAMGINGVATAETLHEVGPATTDANVLMNMDVDNGRYIIIGKDAQANDNSDESGSGNLAIGTGAKALGITSIAIGTGAQTVYQSNADSNYQPNGNGAIAIGANTFGGGQHAIAMGTNAKAYEGASYGMAFGLNSHAKKGYDVAFGPYAVAEGGQSTAFGYNTTSAGPVSIALATDAKAYAPASVALGLKARTEASAVTGVAIGQTSKVSGFRAIAIGRSTIVDGAQAGALGEGSNVAGGFSYAVGSTNNVPVERTMVMGNNVVATQANSVVLGNNSTDRAATTESSATVGGITYGNFAGQGAPEKGVVSVGKAGEERQIINVAAGKISSDSTDAINGSQLYLTQKALGNVANSTANHLGGGSTVSADGNLTAPTYNLYTGIDTPATAGNSGTQINGAPVTNVGDALTALNTYINKGFNVKDNAGTTKGVVTPGESVQFVNGKNTTANVSTEENSVTKITFDVDLPKTGTFDLNTTTNTFSPAPVDAANPQGDNQGDNLVNVSTLVSGLNKTGFFLGGDTEGTGTFTDQAGDKKIANGETFLLKAGDDINVTQIDNGYKLDVAVKTGEVKDKKTAPNDNGLVEPKTSDDGKKLVNITTLANAVNNSGWRVTSDLDGGSYAEIGHNKTNELVRPSEFVVFKAGKNLTIKQNGQNFTYATADDVTFDSVQVGDITINNDGTISNVASNLPDTWNQDEANTANQPVTKDKQELTVNITNAFNNVATVKDIINSGWNLQANGTNKDFVKPYDIVNFTDGVGTKVNITNTDGVTSIVKIDIDPTTLNNNLAGNITNNANGTVKLGDTNGNNADGNKLATTGDVMNAINNAGWNITTTDDAGKPTTKLVKTGATVTFANGTNTVAETTVDADGNPTVKIHVDGDAITNAAKGNVTVAGGKTTVADADKGKLATTDTVSNAINESGWTATIGTDTTDFANQDGKDDALINPADKVIFQAGKNLKVKQEQPDATTTKFTYALDDTVTLGEASEPAKPGENGQPGTPGKDGKDGSITVTGKDGAAVAINGKDGSIGLTGPKGADGKDGVSATMKVGAGPAGVDGKDAAGKDAESKPRIVYVPVDPETGKPAVDENGNPVEEKVATLNDGLKFAGNQGETIIKKLNETLNVEGKLANDAPASASNVRVDSDGDKLIVKIAENPEFNSLTINTADPDNPVAPTNPVTIVTNPKAPNTVTFAGRDPADKNEPVPVQINNITSGLKPYTKDDAPTKAAEGLINLNNPNVPDSNVVTAGDLRNMGWVVATPDNNYESAVKNAQKVNFIGSAGIEVKGENNATTGVYDVKLKLSGAGNLVLEDNVNIGEQPAPTGRIKLAPDSSTNGFVGATNVMNMVNSAGFKATIGKDAKDFENEAGKTDELINAGDKVVFQAGKNLKVKQEQPDATTTKFTYALEDQVTLGEKGEPGQNGQPGKPGKDGFIGVNGKDGSAVAINGKDGSIGLTGSKGKDGKDGASAKISVGEGPSDLANAKGRDGRDGTEKKPRIVYQPVDKNGTPKGEPEQVATLNDGLRFTGDDGKEVKRPLNSLLSVKGGAKGQLTEGNIGVTSDPNTGALNVKLAKDIDLGPSGSIKAGGVTINNNGINSGGKRITNVAPGKAPTDAVNVSQLKGEMKNVHKGYRAGVAGANAAAGLPQVYLPGKSMVAASAGTFKGQAALAVGYSRASDNGKLLLKIQGNTNSQGDIGGSVGLGYQW
ncbi:YadA-like family protein [Pasteurellaceae bacterium 22721_9_1]